MSFLDIMSCGLGAVILFFVIINHSTQQRQDDLTADRSGEVMRLETEVKLEQLNLSQLKNSLEEIQLEVTEAQGRADRMIDEVETRREELSVQENETMARREHFNQLVAELQRMDEEVGKLQAAEDEAGDDVAPFYGEGDRQYLTGLRVGGERILILLDTSASMLDSTIVNIIRRRNLPDDQKIRSTKWQRALLTVDWLTTQVPADSRFQIYGFNVDAAPVLPDTAGEWQEPGEEGRRLQEASVAMRKVIPGNGTRLHAAFDVIRAMNPMPDNVYLIIDSLPTQGRTPATRRDTVTARQRQRFFDDATGLLPVGVPINVILFPMEGDPLASSEFWKLSMATGGSFLAPSRDWP
ncbi:MAG: VWA domain-containing protein [Pseudomonadota bacterium]